MGHFFQYIPVIQPKAVHYSMLALLIAGMTVQGLANIKEQRNIIGTMLTRLGAMSKTHVSTPKSFNFVPKATMDTKKLLLKVDNHPLIGCLVL